MITTNPFAELTAVSSYITPSVMQWFVVLMVALVIIGTILDVMHKQSAKYFYEYEQKMKKYAKRDASSQNGALLVQTITSEVLTSSEFSNPKRRMSHLLTMYGFILFAVTTAIMIFAYPEARGDATPSIWPLLWHLGALMLCIGGYWFWFAIRVDVFSEGHKWYEIDPKEDMFVLSLLFTGTFALLWSLTNGYGLFFALFVLSAIALFAGVYWSKFAHMFFKPAAAYQKKKFWADGSRERLPDIPDLTSAETKERFPDIPMYMGENPPNMGDGIRREPPNHY